MNAEEEYVRYWELNELFRSGAPRAESIRTCGLAQLLRFWSYAKFEQHDDPVGNDYWGWITQRFFSIRRFIENAQRNPQLLIEYNTPDIIDNLDQYLDFMQQNPEIAARWFYDRMGSRNCSIADIQRDRNTLAALFEREGRHIPADNAIAAMVQLSFLPSELFHSQILRPHMLHGRVPW
jgi:hypothetical protein